MIGQSLSHYKIVERLGEGGMGVVYRAHDTQLNRDVAIKVIQPDLMADPELCQRFLREAQALAAIEHPNVCTIHEVDEFEGQHFVVMELVSGQPLKARLTEFSRDPSLLLDVAVQIAGGIGEVHAAHIVHRDLKSANVMLTDKNFAKIMDFGLAKRHFRQRTVAGADLTVTDEISAPTQRGVTVGTVAYLSPEQARGRDVDARSDLFSLGVVLYEMATTERPFTGDGTIDIIDAVLHQEPIPPTHLNASTPTELERIILKSLRKDPSERYQSAGDLLADLKNLKRTIDSGTATVRSSPAVRESSLRSTLSITVAILLLLLSTLGVVWGFARWRRAGESPRVNVATEGATLAVFPFENQTGDTQMDWYGQGAAEWLSVDLSKLDGIDVISSHQLLVAARELSAETETTLRMDLTRAHEIAERARARYLLRGTTFRIGSQAFVKAEIIEVATGKVITAHRISDVTHDSLIEKLGQLAALLRQDLQGLR